VHSRLDAHKPRPVAVKYEERSACRVDGYSLRIGETVAADVVTHQRAGIQSSVGAGLYREQMVAVITEQ
jgi:hypothetical protein